MKSHSLIFVFSLLAFLFGFTACNNNEEDAAPDSGLAPEGQMIATVAGEAWTSNVVVAAVNTSNNQSSLTISSSRSSGDNISITFRKFPELTTKTYSATGAFSEDIDMNHTDTEGAFYGMRATSSVSITITELDRTNKTISGTFVGNLGKFSDATPISIADGSFTKIPYTE